VVELDALADAVRAGAEDDHRLARTPLDLVRGAPLPARVEVRRARLELGGAGVDRLERALAAERRAGVVRELLELVQEPRVDLRARVDVRDGGALAEGLEQDLVAVGG